MNIPARKQPEVKNESNTPGQNPATGEISLDLESSLAQILLADEVITKKQLRHSKRIKSKLSQDKSLLVVLQDLKYIDKPTLLKNLRKLPIKPKLGELLVELGYIKFSDLRSALSIQRETQSDKKLGSILIENHFVSEEKLLDVLSVQLGVPRFDPDFSKIDEQILRNVNPTWCRENQMIPVGVHKGRMIIATPDPTCENRKIKAEQIFGDKVMYTISKHKAIDEAASAFEKSLNNQKKAKSTVGASEAVQMVESILNDALVAKASDIHIEPMQDNLRIRYRCDGVMVPHKAVEKELADSVISRLKILSGADITEKRRHQDGRIEYEDPLTGQQVDLRASFYITIFGEKVVLRVLSSQVDMLSVEELGLPPRAVEKFYDDVLDTPSGIILITGPTGSGKTTTLYSCINYLNSIERSIITAEDPVEYVVEGIAQCSLNPKIELTYDNTLPYMVRQDPDVIVLGEIRDNLSADAAIQAALTGHKVLTTFHTEDTIGGLMRLMNMNIESFLISSTVVSVLAQRLLRRVCKHCAEPYQPTPSELKRLGYNLNDLTDAKFLVGQGCEQCRYTGYKGRLGIYELLVLNEEVKDAILQNCSALEIRRVSFESSEMTTLLEDGLLKAVRGDTTLSEVLRHLPRIEKPRPINELKRLTGTR